MLSLLPVGTNLIAGSFDGVLKETDNLRHANLFVDQIGFWYELGLVGFGGTMAYLGGHEDLAEPLLYLGVGRMGSRLGYWLGTPGGPKLSD